MTLRQGLILVCQVAVLAAATTAAVASSRAADWATWELVVLLFALCVGSDLLTITVRDVRISGSFLALVLAMTLLGPAPAALIGVSSMAVDAVVTRPGRVKALNNLAVFTIFPLVGGLLMRALEPSIDDSVLFAAKVLFVFMITNFLNFAIVAMLNAAGGDSRFVASVRTIYLPVLPSEFATGLLTAVVAFSYSLLGVGVVGLMAVVLFVFQYLIRAGIQAYERGEELKQRTRELASLHLGLITTVMQTLSMRDPMTARHSAAVARYAHETALELGLGERELELIHTAGLLHDIGKFIFPDSILSADRKLTEEEWEIVKLHPEQGAKLVRNIEGYGPIADIIISHHERYDGRGYPYGLVADEIPLGARILAVCDTYDVMTGRDTYRKPVSSDEALAELRRVSGTQLDPDVVTAFCALVETGQVAFRHADHGDFEAELAFERRVDAYTRPRVLAA